MFIVSPKWLYLGNKKLDHKKSLLIDGTLIADILSDTQIEKKYGRLKKVTFDNHVLMPTLCESYLNIDDCENQNDYSNKLNSMLKQGVTNIQINSKDHKKYINHERDHGFNITYMITLDGSKKVDNDIKDMIKLLDFYKSDSSKHFSVNLNKILHFDKKILEKISSICNELNLNINIHMNDFSKTTDSEAKEFFKFWDDINLLNNCSLQGFNSIKLQKHKYFNKKNITLLIDYSELNDIENIKLFLSLLKQKYKCVLVTNRENHYRFYDILNFMSFFTNSSDLFNPNGLIDCVTSNASRFFSQIEGSSIIKKGGLASFNIFNLQSNTLLEKERDNVSLIDIDNKSLTNVWSFGKRLYTSNEYDK